MSNIFYIQMYNFSISEIKKLKIKELHIYKFVPGFEISWISYFNLTKRNSNQGLKLFIFQAESLI
jgi:hypothetical protein